jgi:chromosome segregation ATPase
MSNFISILFVTAAMAASFTLPVLGQTPATATAPNIQSMIESVKLTAGQLRATLDALPKKLDEAAQSPAIAEKTFSELGDTVRGIQGLLAENSDLWKKHAELSDFTDRRAKSAQEQLKKTGEQRWKDQVDRWEQQRAGLRAVRDDIIRERERTKQWLENVERDRDFLVDALVLRQVDVAVAELRKSASEMKKMNDGMDSILKELSALPMTQIPN